MTDMAHDWLTVEQRSEPLILSFPHTGTEIPAPYREGLQALDLARRDADWWIDKLYAFGRDLGATFVHTAISRTVIDVNRDPSGRSLYPGQPTTELCPLLTFDGTPLYKPGQEPDSGAIAERRRAYFDPYHEALSREIARLRQLHPRVVLYDCHSIRSIIPRLFDGALPVFNIGTNRGASCDATLRTAIAKACESEIFPAVLDGRFTGGWITRSFGKPDDGVHAVQMELACRGYMHEPDAPVSEQNWPQPWDEVYARDIQEILKQVLQACLQFAKSDT
jgi:N-formylglutamate deformylase